MKKFLLCIAVLALIPLQGSAQEVRDLVWVDGKGHFVRADPLYLYLYQSCPPKLVKSYVEDFCMPEWPNYTRTWEIRGDKLYLNRIENNAKTVYYPLKRLFPSHEEGPVFAYWFSGLLSYRAENSPLIQLNYEYYQVEDVVRIERGRVLKRTRVNHRDRWIAYAQRIMDQVRPLERFAEAPPFDADAYKKGMKGLLADAFSVITQPEEKPSFYFPVINVVFDAELTDLELTEKHKALPSTQLLQEIADATGCVVDIGTSNRVVTFTVHDPTAPKKPPAPSGKKPSTLPVP